MQGMFAALYELIKETPRTEGGVKTDNSILLIYPPDKESDFREYLLDSFIPYLQATKVPFTHLDLTDFFFRDLAEADIENLQEDEFSDYRWMQQGLSQRVEAALGQRLAELTSQSSGATVLVSSTIALHPLVRYGEVLKGVRDLEGRIVLAFPGEERGGRLHFMNQPDGGNYLAVKTIFGTDPQMARQEKIPVTTVRKIIKRDIGQKIEGVVKVFDQSSLATELREYVVTDKIEEELKRIFDTFTHVSETIRHGGVARDVVGMWISGFFGSGKSHFAKVLGYLLQNDQLSDGSEDYCNDVFVKHLSDGPRGKAVRLRLGEVKLGTEIQTIAFEIKSRQSLTNPNSVGEILLSEFYRHIGLAENFVVARIEWRLEQQGVLEKLATTYEAEFGVSWRSAEGRDDLMTVRRRLADVLPKVHPAEYSDRESAKNALDDMFRHEKITAEGIADELVAWVDAQPTTDGKVQHLVFVIDEMGTFIGDSNERIGEFNSLAEMIGNKGKGKIWLIVTSQQDLEKVVDRTNFQPALVGRLNARFELKPHLISDEINKVVSERILKKHPAEEPTLLSLYQEHEGPIAQLADIKSSRHLGTVSERTFIDCYPFLPHQIRLAQDIFEALSGFRISGGVRSMISVVMDAVQGLADKEIGVVVSFDGVFDAVEDDLLSQEYLGASGVQVIRESGERLSRAPIDPARVLKVLWLLQRITWVPRVPETLAKLLVRRLDTEIAPLRKQVEATLEELQEAGYVARDEATGEWKFLSERERTIEQAVQEMIRPGGAKSFSIAAVRRTSQQMAKESVVIRKKLGNFAVPYGKTRVPFNFGVHLDGEAILTGPEIEAFFVGPARFWSQAGDRRYPPAQSSGRPEGP